MSEFLQTPAGIILASVIIICITAAVIVALIKGRSVSVGAGPVSATLGSGEDSAEARTEDASRQASGNVTSTQSINVNIPGITSLNAEKSKSDRNDSNNATDLESLILVLTEVINESVKHGFDKYDKRQKLYNEQLNKTKEILQNTKELIELDIQVNDKSLSSGDISLLQNLLDRAFDDTILPQLSAIFTKNNLTVYSKDELIKQNSIIISSAVNKICIYLTKSNISTSDSLIHAIRAKEESIKTDIQSCLVYAQQLDLEYIESIDKLEMNFTWEINNTLKAVYGENIVSKLPQKWSSTKAKLLGEV